MIQATKDALASQAARFWADKLIARYGKVLGLKIDSQRKTVEVSCQLKGEATPITIQIENYEVSSESGKSFIRATSFSCTRPWLQSFLMDFGPQKRIELPLWAVAWL